MVADGKGRCLPAVVVYWISVVFQLSLDSKFFIHVKASMRGFERCLSTTVQSMLIFALGILCLFAES